MSLFQGPVACRNLPCLALQFLFGFVHVQTQTNMFINNKEVPGIETFRSVKVFFDNTVS